MLVVVAATAVTLLLGQLSAAAVDTAVKAITDKTEPLGLVAERKVAALAVRIVKTAGQDQQTAVTVLVDRLTPVAVVAEQAQTVKQRQMTLLQGTVALVLHLPFLVLLSLMREAVEAESVLVELLVLVVLEAAAMALLVLEMQELMEQQTLAAAQAGA